MSSKLSPDEYEELIEIFLDVDASGFKMKEREFRFYDEQKTRFERYGVDTYMSGPQWKWLRDIKDRATR